MIRIVHGCNEMNAPADRTVATYRKSLREVFNLPPDATAFVNGVRQRDDYRLAGGDNLEFVKENGHKGLGNLFSPEVLMDRLRIDEAQYRALLERGLPCVKFGCGTVLHPEVAVDEWFRKLAGGAPDDARLADALSRLADHFDPPPADKVDSVYVADRLGCSTTWVAEMVRRGDIPPSYIVKGTGNGKPWKFHRQLIEKWIETR